MPVFPTSMPPFSYEGTKNAAVLLIHGFTGAPDSMLPIANHLHEQGFSVTVPLLAGHGKDWRTLSQTNWPDWYHSCKEQLNALMSQTNHVFVAGLSLGGLLALKLAKEHPKKVRAIACLATPLFLTRGFAPLIKFIQGTQLRKWYPYQKKAKPDVRDPLAAKHHFQTNKMPLSCLRSIVELQEVIQKELPSITTPTLVIHSPYDHTAPFRNMNYITKFSGAKVVETVILKNSQHLISIDYEKDVVSKSLADFFERFL